MQKEIKNKSFDRPSYADKNNIEIINEKNNTNISIKDMIKDPVLLKSNIDTNKINEEFIRK